MHIDRIYIATQKHDVRLARICVASIRYWYPEFPIYLIKDYYNGDFSTEEIERVWNVGVFETVNRYFGWGMSKLEPVFSERGTRMLILDSDTVFTGRVLDRFAPHTEDFIVHFEDQPPQRIGEIYFDLSRLKEFDPEFRFPGQVFNTGQYVATGGLLSREDFRAVSWTTTPPSLKHPEIFRNGEQGVLNYVLMKKAALGQLTLSGEPFMRWPLDGIDDISLPMLAADSPYAEVIHWAGLTKPKLGDMLRADILSFFENFYYSRVPFGKAKKHYRVSSAQMGKNIARVTGKLRRMTGSSANDSILVDAGTKQSVPATD